MSGGSYNYLYGKFSTDLFESSHDLRQMAKDLMAKYPQSQAAHDTRSVVELIDIFSEIIQKKIEPLEQVWRAQEWYESGDSDENYVMRELWNYEHPAPDELREPTSP